MSNHAQQDIKSAIENAYRQNLAYYNDRAEALRKMDHPGTGMVCAATASMISALGKQLDRNCRLSEVVIGSQLDIGLGQGGPEMARFGAEGEWIALAKVLPTVPTWSAQEQAKYPFAIIMSMQRPFDEFLKAHQLPDSHHPSSDIVLRDIKVRWDRRTKAEKNDPTIVFPAIFEMAWAQMKDQVYPKPAAMIYPIQRPSDIPFTEGTRDEHGIAFYSQPTEGVAVRTEIMFFPENLRRAGATAALHRI